MFLKYLKEKSRSEFAWWQQMAQQVFMWGCILAITWEFLKLLTPLTTQYSEAPVRHHRLILKTWKYVLAFERKNTEESTLISHSRVSLPLKWPPPFQNENKYCSNLSYLECLPDLFLSSHNKAPLRLRPIRMVYWWPSSLRVTNGYS